MVYTVELPFLCLSFGGRNQRHRAVMEIFEMMAIDDKATAQTRAVNSRQILGHLQ